jgi:hypothetical protein
MKYKFLALLTSVAITLSFALPASTVLAAAYGTPFITSITYQNLSGTAANITFNFQAENSSTQTPYNTTLPGNASASLFLGSVGSLSSGFKGSAVMSSDQPIVATLVQLPQGSATVKNRPLSDGFATGSATVLIATALKNHFNESSIVTIQNSDSVGADLTVNFFAVGNPVAVDVEHVTNLPAGASKYFDLGNGSGFTGSLPADFNGSVTVTAAKTGTATPGNAVGTVMELSTDGNGASAFEGVASGSTTVYMPSALCNAFGGQNSAYAIQNASTTTAANVTVHYSDGHSPSALIAAGGKHSFLACADGFTNGGSGSATITSDQPIVAIGKVSGLGLSTAFVGASSGGSHLALPYVRWATDGNFNSGAEQRTFIAIQNIGGPLAADQVVVHYLDKNGVEQGTQTIHVALATGGKVSSWYDLSSHSPSNPQFGIYPDGSHGGGVSVTGPGGSQLVAIARVASFVPASGETVGEDYNGFSVP